MDFIQRPSASLVYLCFWSFNLKAYIYDITFLLIIFMILMTYDMQISESECFQFSLFI